MSRLETGHVPSVVGQMPEKVKLRPRPISNLASNSVANLEAIVQAPRDKERTTASTGCGPATSANRRMAHSTA